MKLFMLRTLLFLFSLGFAIGVFEVGLRLAGYEPIFAVYSKPSMFWQHDDLLGWAHTPGARGRYVGPRPWPVEFDTPIEINSLGLRGPEVEPLPPGGLRILASGDSRIVAFEVPYERTFPHLLSSRLSKELGVPVQVVNAGVRGYGTDQSYLYYTNRGHELKPDLVLFLGSNNDTRNNVTVHRVRRPFGKAVFRLDSDGELDLVGVPVPKFSICSSIVMTSDYEVLHKDSMLQKLTCTLQLWLFDRSATFTMAVGRIQQNPQLLRHLYRMGAPKKKPESVEPEVVTRSFDRELTAAILTRFARAVREDGAEMLILGQELGSGLGNMGNEAVTKESARVMYIDPAFEGLDPASYRFVNDSHWTELGNEALTNMLVEPVAEILRARLESRGDSSNSVSTNVRDGARDGP